ncbi:hypothetical protein OIC43_42645 [Streptomyces sp. NBC_00825]|uniref:hypothetical protein n=2 Tax=Streptomyces TaxID=1883 RepID=UPI0022562BE1|nr:MULTISPECIES: hypothetical protein [unclassified Streptomyces]WTB51880.1 hypothetical protein OG832_01035 [Streptomyces sp. NBC_00826]WTH95228.1 hypothetical protein OIC43_42645 [Streptomyces sp. NBC_00825]WTI03962.1 hypothetical protein OHA23_42620 [Streptomyces sp. NBC_00822]MCX4869553.1 hypothetical protein [Streptomyces sp. NBC_00906]MCX4900792.1 hypothetical protein [Streptomyces sp. NBC_00892]
MSPAAPIASASQPGRLGAVLPDRPASGGPSASTAAIASCTGRVKKRTAAGSSDQSIPRSGVALPPPGPEPPVRGNGRADDPQTPARPPGMVENGTAERHVRGPRTLHSGEATGRTSDTVYPAPSEPTRCVVTPPYPVADSTGSRHRPNTRRLPPCS